MASRAKAEHDELRSSMRRFAELLRASGPADPALLTERMRFARLFSNHLAHEQEGVARILDGDPSLAALIRERSSCLQALRCDYSAHVTRWTPAAIRAEWSAYRRSVLALQERLYDFMTWEENNLPIYA